MEDTLEIQIKKLRQRGYSYREIKKELGCSSGTISYHLSEGQKEKTLERTRQRRNNDPLRRKLDSFTSTRRVEKIAKEAKSTVAKLAWVKTQGFQRRMKSAYKSKSEGNFTFNDVIEKMGRYTTCYLTGEPIDLMQPQTYEFDHIIPATKGGSNTLDNLGICCKEANRAKSDLSVEEFVEMCGKVAKQYSGLI